ncbi:odorant receptor coreceptor-like [Anabrus simplex]|uniref:odorant receptor coreceptor-like n=1 Tax=Anabrus simplex TaxID=316456 RepID=UPI0035A2C837
MADIGGQHERLTLEAVNTSFRTVTDRALKVTKENSNFSYEGAWIKDHPMFQETLHYYMHLGLNECIEEHQKILRIMKDVREFYNPLFLVQFLATAVVLCFSVFLTLMATGFSYQYTTLMHLWGHSLPQIFLFCWYGTKFTDLSTSIRSSVYGCDWYNAPKSFKSKVLIVMIQSGKEFQLKVGNVLPLSVGTFANIIYEVGSYVVVMKSLVDQQHEQSHSSTSSFNATLHH